MAKTSTITNLKQIEFPMADAEFGVMTPVSVDIQSR
jgi:hypothetical protein